MRPRAATSSLSWPCSPPVSSWPGTPWSSALTTEAYRHDDGAEGAAAHQAWTTGREVASEVTTPPAERGKEGAADAAGVTVPVRHYQPGGGQEVGLERAAVDARVQGPPPPARERGGEPAGGIDDIVVSSACGSDGMECVVGRLAVAGVHSGCAPVRATHPVEDARDPTDGVADADGANSRPPPVALDAVYLDPPVPEGIDEPRIIALHHHPLDQAALG